MNKSLNARFDEAPRLGGKDRIRGILLGAAVGDALGLPAEGLSRIRTAKFYHGQWRHRFLPGRGMVSDDTDHMVFACLSLLSSAGSADAFSKTLAAYLKMWLFTLPAGIGLATLRSILKLWLGFGPKKSGVYSAGNGPAMRVSPIAAFYADSPEVMDRFVEASTRITHTDIRALVGTRAVAYMVAWCLRERLSERPPKDDFINSLISQGKGDGEWEGIVDKMSGSLDSNLSVSGFANSMELEKGVTGYVYHTVPIALYAWYRHFGDFEATLCSVLDCGGDTDTVGAITGALCGAAVGERGIPGPWITGIVDYPHGLPTLYALADELAGSGKGTFRPPNLLFRWLALSVRNAFFLVVVLLHGFRRLVPPY
jgi:ADP-ribosylglycohydrolase